MVRTLSATLLALAILVCHALHLFGSPPRRDLYGDPLPEGVRVRMGTIRLRHADAQAIFSADGRLRGGCSTVLKDARTR